MSDAQRHVHYTKIPFFSKLFYLGVGAALYWMAFNGGCDKVKSFASNAMDNQPEPIQKIQNAYYSLVGKSIDDRVQPSKDPDFKAR